MPPLVASHHRPVEAVAVARRPMAAPAAPRCKPHHPPLTPYLRTALYDYDAQGEDELSLRKGQIVEVLSEDAKISGDEGWWTGKIGDRVSINITKRLCSTFMQHYPWTTSRFLKNCIFNVVNNYISNIAIGKTITTGCEVLSWEKSS